MSQHIVVEKTGRRFYLRNTPFSAKGRIKSAGCKWDPESKAWYTGKAEVAAELARELSELPAKLEGFPRKMDDGTWGAFLPATKTADVRPGAEVTITSRSGKSWTARVSAVGTETEDGVEVHTEPRSGDATRRSPAPARRRRGWRPCGYPGCSPSFCDECDGDGR